MNKILIRDCTQQDLESIFHLDELWEKENIAYVFTYESQEDFRRNFERFREYFLVAVVDEQIIGYINGSVLLNEKVNILPKQEKYLEIENIYIRPEFRNLQVGGGLIDKLLEVTRQNGINRFIVNTVSKDTDRIMKFYRCHGFEPWFIEFFRIEPDRLTEKNDQLRAAGPGEGDQQVIIREPE